ncbi:hypothetical protein ACUN0C_10180 [Faunimonas sp. B44]|uniref:hypothetical protein n=1 Tax=Faunimonas sp. B44 TaxID=3461493 RepID=UPI0040444821
MLVFGDQVRTGETRARIAALSAALAAVAAARPGIERHSALASAFIDASEVAQAIADADFAGRGCDDRSAGQDAAMALVLALARALGLSWDSAFRAPFAVPMKALGTLAATPLPDALEWKVAEGFAFYAVYPEAYWRAAATCDGDVSRVVGIRSIGLPLAAMVAARLGAGPPLTVRPVGDPFRRRLSLAADYAADLANGEAVAIVDEGPGLSGSSFGAVAGHLCARGLPEHRVHFFPSHRGGPGPEAEPRWREAWLRSRRHVVAADDLILQPGDPVRHLSAWFEDLLGKPIEPLRDLSGGTWRALHFRSTAEWPPADLHQERRKLLLRTETGDYLLKFVGLGREGMRKAERAKALAAAGFAPETFGYRYGFTAERWMGEAVPLRPGRFDRERLLETLGRYMAFRIGRFPATPDDGACLETLTAMARRNISLALGAAAAERLPSRPPAARLDEKIETDGRMHPWEWLALPDGRILKADGVDHHAAHDLVGCQDPAWDVAGATIELGLTAQEQRTLLAAIAERSGRSIDPRLIAFLTPCYLAFQLGAAKLAADALAAACPDEAARLRAERSRYAGLLTACLGPVGSAGPLLVAAAAASPSL